MWYIEEMDGPVRIYFRTHAEVLSAFNHCSLNDDGYIPWIVGYEYKKDNVDG